MLELSNISMPMAALLASLIGASATITAALLNLRMAWKKELLARAQQKPVTKKSSRAPVMPILVLVLGAAAGGFALSYYHLGNKSRASAAALEAELRLRIEQLDAATRRLEIISRRGIAGVAQQVRTPAPRRSGPRGAVASVVLERCEPGARQEPWDCDESTAQPVKLCTEVPADARILSVELHARAAGDPRPWTAARIEPGEDFGAGRFAERTTETLIDETTRQVCQELRYWNSESPVVGRMVVYYDTEGVTETQRALVEKRGSDILRAQSALSALAPRP